MKTMTWMLSASICLGLLLTGCGNEPVDDAAFLEDVRDTAATGSEAGLIDPGVSSPPQIELETMEFDMGLIPAEGFTFKEMLVYNRGGAPLTIGTITTQCPCTTAEMKDSTIPAGGVGTMVIKLDPEKVSGYHSRKKLTIPSNDPRMPTIPLIVAATVEGEIQLSDRDMLFGTIEEGQAAERVIRVTQTVAKPMVVEGIQVTGAPDFLKVDVLPAPPEEWKTPSIPEFLIVGKVSEKNKSGSYDSIARIRVNTGRNMTMTIPIKLVIAGDYSFEPGDVTIRNAEPGETYSGVTVLTSKVPVEVIGVSSSNANLKLSFEPGTEPNSYRFDLVIPEKPENRLQKDEWKVSMKVDGKDVEETIKVVALMSR